MGERDASNLTFHDPLNTLFNVKLTTRELVKNLSKAKAAALRGQTVEIVDINTGAKFHLVAVSKRQKFRDVAAKDAGTVHSKRSDLSTIEGFDD